MGEKDLTVKNYLTNPEISADLMNLVIYGGERQIRPEQLRSCDTAKIFAVERKDQKQDKGTELHELRRDLQKVFVMEDEKRRYVLLAVEHQSEIDYSMPERVMEYDVADYQRQMADIKARHKGEYTGNFWKKEKIIPSITIVLYLGAKPWDGPRDILDLFDLTGFSEKLVKYITPYPIHLISPLEMEKDEIHQLRTDLRQIFLIIKYQNDKKELNKVLNEDPGFRRISAKTSDMITRITGVKMKTIENEKGGKGDLIKAIQDAVDEAKAEGIEEGLSKGDQLRLRADVLGYHREGISPETISRASSIPVEDVMKIIAGAEAQQ